MKLFVSLAVVLLGASNVFAQSTDDRAIANQIIAMERAALDRWGKGDVNGYLEIMTDDVTYFDPTLDQRVDGHTAIRKHIGPFAGKITIDRYEMVDPKVQVTGDIAILSFRIINYARRPDGGEAVANRWNTTEVYRRTGGAWRIAHSHFSLTRPVRAAPVAQ